MRVAVLWSLLEVLRRVVMMRTVLGWEQLARMEVWPVQERVEWEEAVVLTSFRIFVRLGISFFVYLFIYLFRNRFPYSNLVTT